MNRHATAWTSLLFCNEFTRAALYFVWMPVVLSHRHHNSIAWIGFCTSCHFAADALTKLFYGVAASRGYARWMLRAGTILAGFSVLMLLFVHSGISLLVFSILFGCGAASVWPAALSHYGRQSESEKGESLAKAFIPWMTGTGVGMFLPNVLLHIRSTLHIVLLAAVVVTAICTWVIQPSEGQGSLSFRKELLLARILSRRITPFLPPMLLQTLVIGIVSPFLELFGVRSLHLLPVQYALLLLGIGMVTVLLLVPFGRVSDRMGQLPLLCISCFTSSISIVVLALCHFWGQALIPGALFGAGMGALLPTWNALFMNALPEKLQSRAVGLFTALEDSGTALGPFVGALTWRYIGPSGPFILSGLVMLVLSAYFFIWWRNPGGSLR